LLPDQKSLSRNQEKGGGEKKEDHLSGGKTERWRPKGGEGRSRRNHETDPMSEEDADSLPPSKGKGGEAVLFLGAEGAKHIVFSSSEKGRKTCQRGEEGKGDLHLYSKNKKRKKRARSPS